MAASTNITLDISACIAGVLKEKHCPEHLQVLRNFTAALRDKEYRDAVEEKAFFSLMKVLSRLCGELQAASRDSEDLQSFALQLQLTAECFRAQRNACVQSARNQSLLRELGFIDVSLKLLSFLLNTDLENRDDLFEPLRCGIQFLGNLAVGNQRCKDDIWRLSFPNLLLQLLCVDDEKAVNYTSMVLHTCLDEEKVEELSELHNMQLALRVMELCRTQPDLDWTVLIATQHFLKSSALVQNMYSGMSHHERVTLLELLLAQLREEDVEECDIPPSVAHFLASSFQKGCGAVLTLATGSASSDEVRELEGIPLILDHCNIDSNNPFISQWAIFAIRNLLEHNTQNQELIAALESHGTADYSALRELGFLVEERDGSLLLKGVRKDL
uniref:Ataxin-10 n=1 Tax=Monopterus albus TaxID=43700 RepID=A0A3Q3J9Z0_MONAL